MIRRRIACNHGHEVCEHCAAENDVLRAIIARLEERIAELERQWADSEKK